MYSFRPEPDAPEREALTLALERLLEEDRPNPYRSEWRRAALEEGLLAADEEESGL
jgi:hypothetical protein